MRLKVSREADGRSVVLVVGTTDPEAAAKFADLELSVLFQVTPAHKIDQINGAVLFHEAEGDPA